MSVAVEDTKMSIRSEQNDEIGQEISVPEKSKRDAIGLAEKPSDLLSKEGFALYIGNPRTQ